MTISTLISDIWSAISRAVVVARHSDLVAIIKQGNEFKVASAPRLVPDDIQTLNDLPVIHLIVNGKTTKTKLTDAEKKFFSDEIRRVNAWLN